MADGFKIQLDKDEALRVEAAARARGLTVEAYVRSILAREMTLESEDLKAGADLAEDIRAVEDFERTGMGVPWEEMSAWLTSLSTANPLPRPKPRKLA